MSGEAVVRLKRVDAREVGRAGQRVDPVDAATTEVARVILDDVRARGEKAVREHAERLGDVPAGGPLIATRAELDAAAAGLTERDRAALTNAAGRIRAFAEGQRASLGDFETALPGGVGGRGRMGHELVPLERAGCYAPGGRYPLPSSVLMTAVTARAAGVEGVWVTAPSAHPVMLAAAGIAGADGALLCGGAQAIGAFAFGCGPIEPCDAIVGPGNRFVTAAKQLVAGRVAIDMLAGPSEVLVLTDGNRVDAGTIAADLLAQAEHDADAAAILVTTDAGLVERVEAELTAQLQTLPTAETARRALAGGSFAVICRDMDEAITVTDSVAPEHLEILAEDAAGVARRVRHAGAMFIGHGSAEAIGDYGIGPNHTLPTSGSARSFGGLSVVTFLRVRTFIEIEGERPGEEIVRDTAELARLEGLEAHARSAERRLR